MRNHFNDQRTIAADRFRLNVEASIGHADVVNDTAGTMMTGHDQLGSIGQLDVSVGVQRDDFDDFGVRDRMRRSRRRAVHWRRYGRRVQHGLNFQLAAQQWRR